MYHTLLSKYEILQDTKNHEPTAKKAEESKRSDSKIKMQGPTEYIARHRLNHWISGEYLSL